MLRALSERLGRAIRSGPAHALQERSWKQSALGCSATPRSGFAALHSSDRIGKGARQSVFDEFAFPGLRPLTLIAAMDLPLSLSVRHWDCAPRLGYFHPLARPWIWCFPGWRRLF